MKDLQSPWESACSNLHESQLCPSISIGNALQKHTGTRNPTTHKTPTASGRWDRPARLAIAGIRSLAKGCRAVNKEPAPRVAGHLDKNMSDCTQSSARAPSIWKT